MTARNRSQGIIIAGLTGIINGDEGLCVGCDLFVKFVRVDQESIRIHIHKHRPAALIHHAVGRCRKRHGRHNHFISGTNSEGKHGGMKGRRSTADGYGVFCSDEVGKHLFKLGHFGARRQPIGTENFNDRLNRVFFYRLLAVEDPSVSTIFCISFEVNFHGFVPELYSKSSATGLPPLFLKRPPQKRKSG